RVDVDQRVTLPSARAIAIRVADPQVDDALAATIDRERRAELLICVVAREVGGECIAHALETGRDVAFDHFLFLRMPCENSATISSASWRDDGPLCASHHFGIQPNAPAPASESVCTSNLRRLRSAMPS